MHTSRGPWEWKPVTHSNIRMHMHCTHKYTFIYAFALMWSMIYILLPRDRTGPLVPLGLPTPAASQPEAVWLYQLADGSLKWTHTSANNLIDTGHTGANWKWNGIETKWIDSDSRGWTHCRGITHHRWKMIWENSLMVFCPINSCSGSQWDENSMTAGRKQGNPKEMSNIVHCSHIFMAIASGPSNKMPS